MTRNRYACFSATLAAVLVMAAAPVFAQGSYVDPFTLKNRALGQTAGREGDVPVGAAIRTDERCNQDVLFKGPRGWAYWNYLADPKPYQNPNLWPDKRPTYFFGPMVLPPGSSVTLRGRFPYVRYFKFSVYLFEHHTFVAEAGGSIDGYDIEPDRGRAIRIAWGRSPGQGSQLHHQDPGRGRAEQSRRPSQERGVYRQGRQADPVRLSHVRVGQGLRRRRLAGVPLEPGRPEAGALGGSRSAVARQAHAGVRLQVSAIRR